MPKRTDLSPLVALLAAFALSGCAVNEMGDAVSDTRSGIGDGSEPLMVEEEFPEAARNCELPTATLTRTPTASTWRMNLLPEIYAARDRPPYAGRISCITHWARERRLILTVEAIH